MPQTHAVFGELAHYGSEPVDTTKSWDIMYDIMYIICLVSHKLLLQ